MSYQSYPGEVIDAEYVEVIPAQRSMGTSLLSRHSRATMSRIVEEASTLSVYDHCRASLAKDGMIHTAMLSLSAGDPQGAAYYHGFVDAYAQGALDMIRRCRDGTHLHCADCSNSDYCCWRNHYAAV